MALRDSLVRSVPAVALAALLAACGGSGDGGGLADPAGAGEPVQGPTAGQLAECGTPSRITPTNRVTFQGREATEAFLVNEGEYDTAGRFRTSLADVRPDERLLLIAINGETEDPGTFDVRVQGVQRGVAVSGLRALRADGTGVSAGSAGADDAVEQLARGEARVRAFTGDRLRAAGRPGARSPRASLRAAAEPVVGSTESFFVISADDRPVTVSATLRKTNGSTLFYVGAVDNTEITDALLDLIAEDFDRVIYPRVTARFGATPDFDDNDRVIVLIARQVGAEGTLGYFYQGDQFPDGTAGLPSNEGDILYLTAPTRPDAPRIAYCRYVADVAPSTLAHELQHMISFHQHVRVERGEPEATWLDEGLSMVAQDVAGFGRTTPDVVGRVADYLANVERFSLTRWEGHPTGNYGASYLFVRWLADTFGSDTLRNLVQSERTDKENLAAATGRTFEDLELDWRGALAFDHTGIFPRSETPELHYTSLNLNDYYRSGPEGLHVHGFALDSGRAAVRRNGAIYLSGRGTGADVTLEVDAAGDRPIRPRLVIVRFPG